VDAFIALRDKYDEAAGLSEAASMDSSLRHSFWKTFRRGLLWSLVAGALLCLALMTYESVFVEFGDRNVILRVRDVTIQQAVQTVLAFVFMSLFYAYLGTRRDSD
jgi:hypothetical protein